MERPTEMMRMLEVMADRVRPQKNMNPDKRMSTLYEMMRMLEVMADKVRPQKNMNPDKKDKNSHLKCCEVSGGRNIDCGLGRSSLCICHYNSIIYFYICILYIIKINQPFF